ncbi:Gamma-aminobutyric acid type B receptor subunit 1 [Holothuria leucospilota]|uniref:Gamma-aminobutyric acid type B receptor subunit 1 n=1 Tax=Holothuria leucospilota TaxID=206669 RepID=A0A9Q1CHG0_HOLLE|nr:Gamma-aminobutyric acid type B receptor subunit 1 [Holothuria leucospilota]
MLIITISVSAGDTNVTLAPYLRSTDVPLVSSITPDSKIITSGSPYHADMGKWFTDGYHFTRETPTSSSTDEIPLFLSALFSLNGIGWNVSGLLVTADLALKHVNDNPDILPGYRLFMAPADSECNDGVGIQKFFDQLFQSPTKLAVIGPGCSVAAQPIASTAHFWNLNVISPSASSPALSNRLRFPKFFRLISSETVLNPPSVSLTSLYKWNRVATIHQNIEIFTLTIADLLIRLKQKNITIISSESFDEDPTNQLENLKKQDAKIFIVSMYVKAARKMFCKIYKLGMYGKGYIWFLPGWYGKGWYKVVEDGQDCTVDEMIHTLESSNYISIQERVLADAETMTVAGITRGQYESQLDERFKQEKFAGYNLIPEAHFGYDSIWAVALALHQTAENLKKNAFEDGQHRGLENFSYSDQGMADMLFKALENVSFTGVSGPVTFHQGDRIGSANIYQLQAQCREGWRIHISYCYLFVTSQKSWDEAARHCRDEGGFLVSILSEDENEALIELGHDQIFNGINQWWVSLTQSKEGDLQWSGGQERKVKWSPWKHDILKDLETCYILDAALKTWLPMKCTSTVYSFICKKRAGKYSNFQHDNFCYRLTEPTTNPPLKCK